MTSNTFIRFYHYLFYRSYYNNFGSITKKEFDANTNAVYGTAKLCSVAILHVYIVIKTFWIFYGFTSIFNHLIWTTTFVLLPLHIYVYIINDKYKKIIEHFDNELKETQEIKDKKNRYLYWYGFMLILIFYIQNHIDTIAK